MAKTLVKSGKFTLRIGAGDCTQPEKYGCPPDPGHTSFFWKYGKTCPADKVCGVVVPLGQLSKYPIGSPALVVDNVKKTSCYCIVYDSGSNTEGWGQVSLKAAWSLGYTTEEANGKKGPSGDFSIYVDGSQQVDKNKLGSSPSSIQSAVEQESRGVFDGVKQEQNSSTAYGSGISGYIEKSQINYKYLKYFIVTLTRNSPMPNFEEFKKHNVAGVMIEAGYLYNAAHVEQYARNPHIHEMCINAEKHSVPFGLQWICKARSEDEAKKEIYELSFMIRKYPPALGMWIAFKLVKSVAENDRIVEYYRKELKKLGLAGKIGIYQTRGELKTISWEKTHYKHWKLWLNEHVQNIDDVNKLLEPSMFTIGTSKQVTYAKNSGNVINSGGSSGSSAIGNVKPTAVYGAPYVTHRGYKINANGLTPSKGRISFGGHTETYYSQRVLPGGGLSIPGRHVASDGTIRDSSGYICVAKGTGSTDVPKGTTLMTSLGAAKVYDSGAGTNNFDLYVDW